MSNQKTSTKTKWNPQEKPDGVPREACSLAVGDVEIESNGADSNTAKFRMVARSGRPIDHYYWGRVVHDLEGMELRRNRVAIDYRHNEDEVLGFANKFDISSGDLVASGALTPYREGDRASEVIYKAGEQQVPYEASINFAGGPLELEQVAEGENTEVNGYTFAGPGVVIRKWPLRGIAVTPYGADPNTVTEFNESDQISVSYREKEMPKEDLFSGVVEEVIEEASKPVEAEVDETVEAEADSDSEAKAETPEEQSSEDESAVEASALSTPASKYIEQFGLEQGSVYFATGVPFVEALGKHLKAQEETINDLKGKLSNVARAGEEMPLAPSDEPKPKERALKLPSWMK